MKIKFKEKTKKKSKTKGAKTNERKLREWTKKHNNWAEIPTSIKRRILKA